jgi:hypothetical protein
MTTLTRGRTFDPVVDLCALPDSEDLLTQAPHTALLPVHSQEVLQGVSYRTRTA